MATRDRSGLQSSVKEVKGRVASRPIVPASEQAKVDADNTAAKVTVAALSAEKALNSFTKARLDVEKTLSEITNMITTKLGELSALEKVITQKTEELRILEDKSVISAALEDLIKQYEEKSVELDAAYTKKEAALAEKAATDQKVYAQSITERDENRKREEAKFIYDRDLTRAKEKDDYEQKKLQRDRADLEERNKKIAELTKRESEVAARESEFKELVALRDAQPDLLKKTADAEFAKGLNTGRKQMEDALSNEKKEHEFTRKAFELERNHFNGQIADLKARLAATEAAVKSSEERAANIAKSALESASGQSAIATLKQFNVGQNADVSTKSR